MSRVIGSALVGIEGHAVEVEVRISSQLPRVDIVGLPEAAVRESTARVRAAIASIGQRFPERRVTINLAPAELRKTGTGLDLAIAIGLLAASGSVEAERIAGCGFIGELALDGRLRAVRGSLALAIAAREAGCRSVVVPADSAREAALMPDLEVLAAPDLGAVVRHLLGGDRLAVAVPAPIDPGLPPEAPCLAEVRGQPSARRALEIAAAGGHGLLLTGPPGAGKTMLARRLPGLLPPLAFDELLDVTRIHGAAGLLDAGAPVVTARPFRAPHHTATAAGLLGGGSPVSPGEVSLAHRGVLFLDELPEFNRRCLESLRQVLEDRRIVVSRARQRVAMPASFALVAAANPCPCGYHGSTRGDCRCDDGVLARYWQRLSGPLLDRIDLQVRVDALAWHELEGLEGGPPEPSRCVRERVAEARARQSRRGVACNAEIPDRVLDALVAATPDARALLGRAVDGRGMSARAARRVLRVARSIADLAGDERVGPGCVAEALAVRSGSSADG